MKNLKSILFWSIISAAFIGPGTVTTAAKSGASFGLSLLWALTFSIIGTVVLQEAAARLSIVSGKNIGQILASGKKGARWKSLLVFVAVAFGCAAYQAGNILGAVAGMQLFSGINSVAIGSIIVFIVAGALLFSRNYKRIASFLGIVVAIMGFSFVLVAMKSDIGIVEISKNLVVPSLPKGADMLVIGLIGTTMVPYNIFLGSGISHGQELRRMRIGLTIAVLIGGIISIAIMFVGTQISGEFSFELLEMTIRDRGGNFLGTLFGIGLMAAGLSSAVTAPLAAAVTAKSTFNDDSDKWSEKSLRFQAVWLAVLLIGLTVGMLGLKIVPVIIAAQAINGLLLPVVACFLILIINDKKIMNDNTNGIVLNILSLFILGICFFVGLNNIFSAASKTFNQPSWSEMIEIKLIIAALGTFFIAVLIYAKGRKTVS